MKQIDPNDIDYIINTLVNILVKRFEMPTLLEYTLKSFCPFINEKYIENIPFESIYERLCEIIDSDCFQFSTKLAALFCKCKLFINCEDGFSIKMIEDGFMDYIEENIEDLIDNDDGTILNSLLRLIYLAENYSEDVSDEIIFGETNINDVLVMLQNNEEKLLIPSLFVSFFPLSRRSANVCLFRLSTYP